MRQEGSQVCRILGPRFVLGQQLENDEVTGPRHWQVQPGEYLDHLGSVDHLQLYSA